MGEEVGREKGPTTKRSCTLHLANLLFAHTVTTTDAPRRRMNQKTFQEHSKNIPGRPQRNSVKWNRNATSPPTMRRQMDAVKSCKDVIKTDKQTDRQTY